MKAAMAKKAEAVSELKEKLEKSDLAVLTDYRGLTVAEMTQLRTQLRQVGVEYKVAKNTLTRFAAEQAGVPSLSPLLVGPTAIAFASDDVVKAAKVLTEYAKSSKLFKIKGAVLQGKVIGTEQLAELAELPPREVLVAKVIGGMQAPIAGLVNVLNGTLVSLLRVLQARQHQLESQA